MSKAKMPAEILIAAALNRSREDRIAMDDVPVMFAFIKAAIDELDCPRE